MTKPSFACELEPGDVILSRQRFSGDDGDEITLERDHTVVRVEWTAPGWRDREMVAIVARPRKGRGTVYLSCPAARLVRTS